MRIVTHKISIWFMSLTLSLVSSSAFAIDADVNGNFTAVQVDRYTANGNKYGENVFGVRKEVGDLYKDETYIPFASGEVSIEVSEATLNALNGKFVMPLAIWTMSDGAAKPLGNKNAMRFFPRSAQTYSIGGVPYVIVTPSAGATTPSPGKPTVTLSAIQANAAEAGPTSGRFLIALDSAKSKDVKVSYAVLGKARNGKDYSKIAKNVLIPAGNVSAYLDIVPINDAEAEGAEPVKLKLNKKSGYKLGGAKSATVTIADDD